MSILIQKKILWRINFVLIKFSLNALLFEKSQNECKNPSFLHKAMCIELHRGSMKMQCCLSTFIAWNYKGLWETHLLVSTYLPIFFIHPVMISIFLLTIPWKNRVTIDHLIGLFVPKSSDFGILRVKIIFSLIFGFEIGWIKT